MLAGTPLWLALGSAWIGVSFNTGIGPDLYVISALLMVAGVVVTPIAAGVLSWRAVEVALTILWVRGDGSVGPWCKGGVRFAWWLPLWLPQIALFSGVLFIFPEYSAGWI